MTDLAEQLIKLNEGCRLKPYRCTEGKLTIGYGRNLEDNGISQYEAEVLLSLDLEQCIRDLQQFPFWEELSEARRAVLIDMRFQLGKAGLMGFKKMLEALEWGEYEKAADELMDSRYAKQTPNRAARNSEIMRTGVYE